MNDICIICDIKGVKKTIRDLPMYLCEVCRLFWRVDQDVPITHYAQKNVDISSEKEQARIRNSISRALTIFPYIDNTGICDIGCAEGVMLKVFRDMGAKGLVGLEPSDTISDYVKKNNILIEKGTIDDIDSVVKKYHPKTYTMFHVIEHLPSPMKQITHLYNLMNEGDCLVIETPDFSSYTMRKTNLNHELIYKEHFFYFDSANIEIFLKKIGFHVVLNKKRDFDGDFLNMRDLLFRLGLAGRVLEKNNMYVPKDKTMPSVGVHKTSFRGCLTKAARFILSQVVGCLGRRDYMIVVAKK